MTWWHKIHTLIYVYIHIYIRVKPCMFGMSYWHLLRLYLCIRQCNVSIRDNTLPRAHVLSCLKLIGAQTKRSTFCRRHFQMHFLERQCMNFVKKFHWSLFRRFQLMIFQHWFRQRFGTEQVSLLTHMCVTRPPWVSTAKTIPSTKFEKIHNITRN